MAMKINIESTVYTVVKEKLTMEKTISFIALISIDELIGVFLFNYFGWNCSAIHTIFWDNVDQLAIYIDMVINWLVNNPAGLKLNEPVNMILSSFFRYHVYLWTTFINFLRNENSTKLVLYTLLGGFSTFASVVRDISKIFSLHFYCFDAYASRLCFLAIHSVSVLWGLMRGKKWNPLRKRRDNVSLDSRQQFISVLLFVILLFILPTISVYFIVFKTLCLCVGTINFTLYLISNWPLKLVSLLK